MTKNILIFTALYLPHLGGVERYNNNLAKHLIKLGCNVTLATSKLKGEKDHEFIEDVEVFRLNSLNLMDSRLPIYNFFNYKSDVNKINNKKYDLVIVNTRYYLISLFGVKYAKNNDVKCILLDHSTGHISFGNPIITRGFELYEHIMTTLIKRYPVSYYGVSERCSEWLTHFNLNSEGVIYNAIDLEAIENLKVSTPILSKYNLNIYTTKVCFTGRLIKEKGVLELVEGFKKYNMKYPSSCLFIAGDGPLLSELKKIENSNIFLLGKINFENVVELLNVCNVFCFPTAYPEGFPTSLLEAAACRCYLMATDKGGARELIKSLDYGYILPSNDPNQIFKGLKYYESIVNKNKILENSYELVKEEFNWPTIAKKVINLL